MKKERMKLRTQLQSIFFTYMYTTRYTRHKMWNEIQLSVSAV